MNDEEGWEEVAERPERNVAVGPDKLLELFERMALIRETETRLGELFSDGKIPGFIHLSIGQEATCVGVCAALNVDDTLSSTHRGHGHCIAKGVQPLGLIQEILGHAEGLCGGNGGSLHVADFSVGMLGANGIVGAGIPIAVGSALAHKTLNSSRIAVSFFGDGAMAEGTLYESLNLASLWQLPILFVCENNAWSEFSPTSAEYVGDLGKLADSFGIRHQQVDGNDVESVLAATQDFVELLRAGSGPAVLECMTLRVRGHYEGDPQTYREGVVDRTVVDPLDQTLAALAKMKVDNSEVQAARERARSAVHEASSLALGGSQPNFKAASANVYL